MIIFVIEDSLHCEAQGKYETFELALEEIRRRATIPWNEQPNVAPCSSWRTCGRQYIIFEYDITTTPWKQIHRTPVVEIDAAGIRWEREFAPNN